MRVYWPRIAVQLYFPGQYLLLRRLAASCIVWGKAEPAIRPFRTILHDALNGQNCSSVRTWISSVMHSPSPCNDRRGGWVTKLYACALFIIDGLAGSRNVSSTLPVSPLACPGGGGGGCGCSSTPLALALALRHYKAHAERFSQRKLGV